MSDAIRPLLFTFDGAWDGAYYELALEWDIAYSNAFVLAALTALWRHPDLEGCYLHRDREPFEQQRIGPIVEEEFSPWLQGIAHMPNGKRVACASVVHRWYQGSNGIDFCVPVGSLAKAYPNTGLPNNDGPDSWPYELEDWLARIGLWIAETVPVRLGLIGHDVGDANIDEILRTGVPEERDIGYLWPVDGVMTYHRRTH